MTTSPKETFETSRESIVLTSTETIHVRFAAGKTAVVDRIKIGEFEYKFNFVVIIHGCGSDQESITQAEKQMIIEHLEKWNPIKIGLKL